eukprot:TRINITY_DN89885_c0_g1_i1.p1 TRINITY_DN89885_c0_g1~~TRINITY_DN89885_c0_g1_i1.p1  ORF type:complete len:915 (-),score=159.00 TRINITY_DN89885_c0_g1_i1:76-2784(-)
MAASSHVRTWAAERVGALLQMPPSSCVEIIENILAYDDPDELKDFLKAFTEQSAEFKVTSFVEELFARMHGRPAAAPQEKGDKGNKGDKGDRSKGRGKAGGGRAGRGEGHEEARGRGRGGPGTKERDFPKLDMPMLPRQEGDKRLMVVDASSGRYEVLTNCLNCGKVVVEEEGWGPCLFCGNPLEVIGDRHGAKRGDDRGRIEAGGGELGQEEERFNASFERAVAAKDRLLSYDRDAKRRTKVYDDATDWYSEAANPWLNEKQREEAKAKGADEERRQREEKQKIHAKIDLFGRTVIDASAEVQNDLKQKDRASFQDWQENASKNARLLSILEEGQRGLGGANSQLSEESQQLYERLRASLHGLGTRRSEVPPEPAAEKEGDKRGTRYQTTSRVEDEFAAISTSDFRGSAKRELLPAEQSPYSDAEDMGQCLSMHQPWASLLVYGFKRAEGRGWKTDYRGRLWIHSAAKPPDEQDVQILEAKYKSLYEAAGVPIPPLPSDSGGYPTSTLLGCVDIEACWTSAEYSNVLQKNPSMPQEESDCDFIFWCLRPRRLVVPLKMGGDHKIWRIERASLAAAQRGLRPVRWPKPTEEGEREMVSPEVEKREATAEVRSVQSNAAAPSSSSGSAPASRAKVASTTVNAAPAIPKGPPPLDLWPSEAPGEVLQVLEKDGPEKGAVVMQSGFVHLVSFVPSDIQQRVVDELREVGVSSRGFLADNFDGVKVSEGVHRMYMGFHWNSASRSWETEANKLDKQFPAPLPKFLADMYSEAVRTANREMASGQNKRRKLVPFPETGRPNCCVAEFCPSTSSIQIHQEMGERRESIDAGYPIMVLCIGCSFELCYSSEKPGGSQKPKAVKLASGDAVLLGGESRLLWHGVQRVIARSSPPSLRMLPGLLNLSIRVN